MNILLNILLLIVGMALLIKGADIFVDAGTNIGKRFKMSEVLIGLTIVCFGTGLPELLLSINGTIQGSSDFVIGNIVGTNIFNMCCILGSICILHPLKLLRETVRKDMNMSLISSIALFTLLLDSYVTNGTENILTKTDGIILLLFFAIFVYYTFYEFTGYLRDKREKKYKDALEKKYNLKIEPPEPPKEQSFTKRDLKIIAKNIGTSIIGILMVHFGSQITVDNAVTIAEYFNTSQTFISIAIIAVGTSLPELTTSVVAIKKNRINIAIGNLIGSNMFNTLLVLGASALINPIKLGSTNLLIDCAVFILVCLVLRMFTKKKPEIYRSEGIILLLIYLVYISYVLYRR